MIARWSRSPPPRRCSPCPERLSIGGWRDGFVDGEQLTPGGPWHIRITDELRSRVVPEAPAGWVGLDQAAQMLGVVRQTVLDRVRRGELRSVHVNRGRRRGLAIEMPGEVQSRLFESAES